MLVKNLQGDVIALVDDQGDTVLEYSYDPWGKLEYRITDPNMDETAAMVFTSLCPLTYRGYNYDFSTGLYYLQSRYYNPEWGRFLNTDDTNIMLAAAKTNDAVSISNMFGKDYGVNLFTYCGNNPVNRVDYNGEEYYDLNSASQAILFFFVFSMLSVGKFENKIKIVADANKKGGILIDICTSNWFEGGRDRITFSTIIAALYGYWGDWVFDFLANVVAEKFYNEFPVAYKKVHGTLPPKRQFLFNEQCLTTEIRDHVFGYWWSIDQKITYMGISSQYFTPLPSVFMFVGAKYNKDTMYNRCRVIDIFEQDAVNFNNRTAFGYFEGIRDVYKYTKADPYWQGGWIRTYQNVREDWKSKPL